MGHMSSRADRYVQRMFGPKNAPPQEEKKPSRSPLLARMSKRMREREPLLRPVESILPELKEETPRAPEPTAAPSAPPRRTRPGPGPEKAAAIVVQMLGRILE